MTEGLKLELLGRTNVIGQNLRRSKQGQYYALVYMLLCPMKEALGFVGFLSKLVGL